jgi:hypothetical protein
MVSKLLRTHQMLCGGFSMKRDEAVPRHGLRGNAKP